MPRAVAAVGLFEVVRERPCVGFREAEPAQAVVRVQAETSGRGFRMPTPCSRFVDAIAWARATIACETSVSGSVSTIASPSSDRAPRRGSNGILPSRGASTSRESASPPRLAHPEGGEPLAGTNPLAIAVPSSDGHPLVADVSMGKVTYGDVLVGAALPEELVPFGDEQAHKAFALAVGLHMLVSSLAGEEHGAVMLVARPEHNPVPGLRARAGGVRLPGDG